ncbi:pathogenesis-related thaumatin superfamily protein [Artemisia annua]|uniref:Pathogenesis-related thaumatin superfamily protein n=1 Tax=Artemisia annua TaxID=35608 RepID=A0A2U1NC11_ARTAN|nr:pathogenesis-related thaumatin superfamily protein [Artemisia annua]
MAKLHLSLYLLSLTISQFFIQGVISSATFTFVNKCDQTIWPGILSNAGIAALEPTGFALQKGETKVLTAPASWGGRFWGRTHCSQDSNNKFTCGTGDCGSGKMECAGAGATPPATLAEFTLDGDGGMDFFDVSLVDGYNLPMLVAPTGGTGHNCTYTGCMVDLNGACPTPLKVMSDDGQGVACKSACEAFGDQEYCCSGAYGTPDTCKPSSYSQLFKTACPRAYSYAYDDKTSTFTCTGADYQVTFCPPSTTSKKATDGQQSPAIPTTPQFSDGMVYEGADAMENSGASLRHSYIFVAIVVALLKFASL